MYSGRRDAGSVEIATNSVWQCFQTLLIEPKLSQNPISELKVTMKMKVVQVYDQTQKKFSNPTQAQKVKKLPKNQFQIKSKIGPLNQMKLKARIEGYIENICCFKGLVFYFQISKKFFIDFKYRSNAQPRLLSHLRCSVQH